MTRSATIKRMGVTKPEELVQAEQAGQQLLYAYCRAKHGNQAFLMRTTGLITATLSRMQNGDTPINFEAAMLIEVATKGELPADKLCPSRADLVAQFLQLRSTNTKDEEQDA